MLSLEPRASAGVPAGPAVGVPVDVPAGPYGSKSPADLLAFVRIACTTWRTGRGWMRVCCCGRLTGWPGYRGVLIHGRLDMSCPLDTAWELARAWPDAELLAPKDSGHFRSMSKRERLLVALDGFATR